MSKDAKGHGSNGKGRSGISPDQSSRAAYGTDRAGVKQFLKDATPKGSAGAKKGPAMGSSAHLAETMDRKAAFNRMLREGSVTSTDSKKTR